MKRLLAILCTILCIQAFAQTDWPSPEVEQMYNHARADMMQGNIQQAIITYQQAITLAPDHIVLYRDLAQAYYLAGGYDEALKVLEPIMKNRNADEQSYQIKASCLIAKKEDKKAKSAIQEGLKRYPRSGVLYHELGKLYEEQGSQEDALSAWLDGIRADPAYHINYYEAARLYMGTKKPVWAVIYAEMFLNIEQHTPRADETRDMLLGAYMRLYKQLGTSNLPQYKTKGNKLNYTNAPNFEDAVNLTYLKLSPVVSDGINTENLTMLRTRFLMEWSKYYASRFPMSLFQRQDDMLRNGYFDVYNQWLFGKIDAFKDFEIWKTVHPEAIPNFETWLKDHPYKPFSSDFYNNRHVDGIFIKEKKKDE